jgi:hypothetical protein
MKHPVRYLLLILPMMLAMNACMGETVEIIDIDSQGEIGSEPGLIGNVPVSEVPQNINMPTAIIPISISTPLPPASALVEATALNVREGPDTSFPIITSVQQGENLEVLGQFRSCDWLRVHIRSGERGWVKSGPGYAYFDGNCGSVPSGPFRPLNGTLVYDRRMDYGPGTLTVENMTLNDGLVVLTSLTNDPLVGFYIRSTEEFKLTGLQDGDFLLYFTYGHAWDGNKNTFMVVETVKKMDQVLEFYSDDGGYTTWTLSLNSLGIGSGSASASDIPASSFPVLN